MLPRGQGKSALVAALGLYDLMLGAEGLGCRSTGLPGPADRAGPGAAVPARRELADPWLPPRAWDACAEVRPIPAGAEVILALDGSFSQDATAPVAAEVAEVPHLDVAGLWESPPGRPEYRVPILDVEEQVRECCRR
jgi:hypothetical protein